MAAGSNARPIVLWCCTVGLVIAHAACSRTTIGVDEPPPPDASRSRMDAARPLDAGPDATEPPLGTCTPATEACNGSDDDCNGVVDDMAPLPCEGGGASYCVAGRMSACPTRCELCAPGSTRACFTTLCTYWGTESCSADGRSFGRCREGPVPDPCEDTAMREHDSPELEQCCIDRGFCCRDQFDLDGDGDVRESLGTCDGTACE